MHRQRKGFLARRLSKALARFRGEASQNQFARRLGISNASLNRLENQVQNISLKTLEQLCRALKCDVVDLFPPERPHRS
jgi:DNA-binding Xre family transcriptional regulator